MKKDLTPKQVCFINEYLIDLNATQAAIRAGYSPKTARQIGEQNLSKLYMKKEIDKRLLKRNEMAKITAEMVLKELAKIAFMDLGDYIKQDDSDLGICMKSKFELEANSVDLSHIPEVSIKKGVAPSFKVSYQAKMKALELLAKHTGVTSNSTNGGRERDWKAITERVRMRIANCIEQRKT